MSNPYFVDLPFTVTLTDAIYWAAQPLPVQALQNADPTSPATAALATQLAQQGFLIDVPIMVWGWDPVLTMVLRTTAGYTWVPSALQPAIQEIPGVTNVQGGIPYNASPIPAGSIKVSVNANDYPAVAPPPPPPAPEAENVVGPKSYANVYIAGPGALVGGVPAVVDGKEYTQNGVSYTAHVYQTMFGVSVYFTQP